MSAIGELRESKDPDLVWTHDDARALVRSVAPGAIVEFTRTRDGDPDAAQYRITLERVGRKPVAKADFYVLPFRASDVAQRVRTLAALAAREV